MTNIKKVRRKIIRLVVTGTLAGAQGALAGVLTDDVGAFRSQDAALVQSLPNDVRGGSVPLDEERYSTGLTVPVALVPREQAVQTALNAGFCPPISAELETENGYLVRAVKVRDADGHPGTVMVDAGTGQLLAFDDG